MRLYYLGYYHYLSGSPDYADHLSVAASADPAYCFPNRLEDIILLQFAIEHDPDAAKAFYYLGNLWYDKRQYEDAIRSWTISAEKGPLFPTVFRNLGIAAFNKQAKPLAAVPLFEKAFSLDRSDARVLMELDQLYKKSNYPCAVRLASLKNNEQVAYQRDDLYLEMAALYNFNGDYEKALEMIMSRKFHPWEGGEGRVSGQYVYSLTELAKLAIAGKQFADAIDNWSRHKFIPQFRRRQIARRAGK